MALFSGRYEWDGTRQDNLGPVAWFSGSYELTIFELDKTDPEGNVTRLKTHICLFSRTGEGQSMVNQPEKFAKRICQDFGFNMDRVLWIEDHLTSRNRYEVLCFTRTGKMGDIVFYSCERRYPHPWENHVLLQAIEEFQG